MNRFSSALAKWTLFLICLASLGLMLYASRGDSAIDDELAHIPAGYGYVSQLSYNLNPEHPPLTKALAMLPVLAFEHPNFPTTSTAWTTELNGEWDMGTQFLYQSGNDANAIIQLGRVGPMLITLLVVLLIWFLARGLMGDWWALLPSFLFAMDPTVLAQGHYVTTDVGAAFGIILASYFFLKFIEAPSTKHLWWAGIAFGVAQLTKFSTPLLVPLFIFLALVLWLRDVVLQWHEVGQRFKTFFKKLCRGLWRVILIFAIGYIVVVYPVYFLFTAHYPIAKQISDTQTTLASFANGPTPAGQICKSIRCLADLDIWMSKSAVFRPFAEYLLGILMALQRVDGGNTIYFLGRVVGTGGWMYFPILFLLKEPIPTLVIVLFALGLAFWWIARRARAARGTGGWARIKRNILDYIGVNFAEFSMASFIVLYWGYSMHAPLNIGLRHVLPTFPFIFILAAGVWKKWVTQMNLSLRSIGSIARSFVASAIKYIVLVALLVWLLCEAVFAAPYFLSYFNELGGGAWNGYHYVDDSNYDWGQDLLRLQAWVNANPQVGKIAVDYFGGGDPQYYLGNKEVKWSSAQGNPANQGIQWLAVSVNTLELATQPLAPGQTRDASDTYSWLTALRPPSTSTGMWPLDMGNVPKPDARAGTSIFIYHL